MSEEADPKDKAQEERVRDFEGRWQGPYSLEASDSGLECGKCAEYLLGNTIIVQIHSLWTQISIADSAQIEMADFHTRSAKTLSN